MSKFISRQSVLVWAFALVCSMFAGNAFAQTQASTGQITGAVRDASGAVVPNATVKVANTQTGLNQTLQTNQEGAYRAILLPAGTYTITVSASGFGEAKITDVQVQVGRTFDVNPVLQVGQAQETINVTAEGIQVTRSEADALQGQTQIENLPINGRRFQDFVTLTPTAQIDAQRGQISLSGQRGVYGANLNIDGLDYNQPFFGGIRGGERSNTAFTIPQEAIREFQVVAAGYSPEFGRSTGGTITAVTKSGDNTLHGSAFYLHRDKEFVNNNDFYNAVAANQGREIKPAPTQQQWGGSIGGAAIQDKLFYFGAIEQQRVRNTREVLFGALNNFTPTAGQLEAFNYFKGLEAPFETTNDVTGFLVRGDYQITDKHRANLRFSQSRNEAKNGNTVGNPIFPTTFGSVANNGTEKSRVNTVVGQMASFFGSAWANELRFQYAWEARPRESNSTTPTLEASNSSGTSGIGRDGAVNFLPNTQKDNRFQLADSLTWITGNHSIKVGGEFSRIYFNQFFGFDQFGRYRFISTTNVGNLLEEMGAAGTNPNRFDNTNDLYTMQIGNRFTEGTEWQGAIFVQDAFRILPNLTLNYGIRWEGEWLPDPDCSNTDLVNRVRNASYPSGRTVDPCQIQDQNKQFAPRAGLAWDPFKNGKTVIRANSGIYYATSPLLLYSDPLNNFRSTPGNVTVTLPFNVSGTAFATSADTLYEQFRLIGVDLNTVTLDKLPTITPAQIAQISTALGITNDPFRGAQVLSVSPEFKNPRSIQAGFGIEHELTNELSIGLQANLINTSRLQRNFDVNLPLPTLLPVAFDPAQRPFYGTFNATTNTATAIGSTDNRRPERTLGSIQLRESTARSLYRDVTLNTKYRTKRMQLAAFYTWGKNFSSDDNERDSGGVQYVDTYNLLSEYGYSRLDTRHQFKANPVFFLPFDFDLSSAIRMRSGRPIDATAGADLNGDRINNDRPYSAAGVPFVRNGFRNKAQYLVDARVQKRIKVKEGMDVRIFADVFNMFNFENVNINSNFNYCTGNRSCGLNNAAPTNASFVTLRKSDGTLNLGNNTLDSLPRQWQLGARFTF